MSKSFEPRSVLHLVSAWPSSFCVSTRSRSLALVLCATMGFSKTIIRAGNGVLPRRGQNVTVHCTGYGKNRNLAEKFWSTKDPGQEPFTFAVGMGQVIKVRTHREGKKDECAHAFFLLELSFSHFLKFSVATHLTLVGMGRERD